jgi:hypothetical protein
MTIGKAGWAKLAAACVALAPLLAAATPITFDFLVAASSGPLAGTTSAGTFTFDSGSIPAVLPGTSNATGLLTGLSFSWDGIAYNAATGNTGWLTFDAAGDLLTMGFGTSCAPGSCSVEIGTVDQWYVIGTMFAYAVPGAPSVYFGSVEVHPHAAVPEPGAPALLVIALAALAMPRRRAAA